MNSARESGSAADTGMVWGIKKSFLNYLSRTPDSLSSVTDGADLTHDGTYQYRFASAPGDSSTFRFEGSVRFTAHAGALRIGFTNPEISLTPEGASLSIVDHFSSAEDGRIEFAQGTLAKTDEPVSNHITITQLRLTEGGAELFQHIYETGEAFEDIIINLSPAGANRT